MDFVLVEGTARPMSRLALELRVAVDVYAIGCNDLSPPNHVFLWQTIYGDKPFSCICSKPVVAEVLTVRIEASVLDAGAAK
jgi:hypothetical protein